VPAVLVIEIATLPERGALAILVHRAPEQPAVIDITCAVSCSDLSWPCAGSTKCSMVLPSGDGDGAADPPLSNPRATIDTHCDRRRATL
jgi:hypothetical protein